VYRQFSPSFFTITTYHSFSFDLTSFLSISVITKSRAQFYFKVFIVWSLPDVLFIFYFHYTLFADRITSFNKIFTFIFLSYHIQYVYTFIHYFNVKYVYLYGFSCTSNIWKAFDILPIMKNKRSQIIFCNKYTDSLALNHIIEIYEESFGILL
jgi:hypothetical protein